MKIKRYPKQKLVYLDDIDETDPKSLESELAKIILKYPRHSIQFDLFNNLNPNYRKFVKILKKLNFKLIIKKPVFEKKVNKTNLANPLSFVKNASKQIIYSIYKDTIKNTEYVADYID